MAEDLYYLTGLKCIHPRHDPKSEVWGLNITELGTSSLRSPAWAKPQRQGCQLYSLRPATARVLNEYALVYLTGGNGHFQSESSEKFQIKGGDLFFLFPGIAHTYGPDPQTGWDETWIIFQGYFADQLRKQGVLDTHYPLLSIGLDPELTIVLDDMLNLASRQESGVDVRLAAKLYAFLTDIYARQKGSICYERCCGELAIRRACEILAPRLDSNIDMRKLARRCT